MWTSRSSWTLLAEVTRHGTTTTVMSNCSLGLAFGAQRRNGEDPIVDCFARVENIPKHVLQKVADRVDWTTRRGYLDHLRTLPLGANVVPMVPHSMLRSEVMGLRGSVSRDPTAADLQRWPTWSRRPCARLRRLLDRRPAVPLPRQPPQPAEEDPHAVVERAELER